MSNILCTGGTGFVGTWLQVTQPKGNWVVGLDKIGYEDGFWKNYNWDYIIHVANVSPQEVIKVAQKNNARLLYISSGAVYHKQLSEYGRNKVCWEQEVRNNLKNYAVARLFTFCGRKLKWDNFVIGSFIGRALHNIPLEIWGDGTTLRSYMYGEDLGNILWTILLDGNRDYDVGNREPISILDLAKLIIEITGSRSEIMIDNNYTDHAPDYYPKSMWDSFPQKYSTFEAVSSAVKDYYDERLMPYLWKQ